MKTIKAKGKNLPVASMFYEDDDEEEEEEEEDEEGEGLSFDIEEDMEDEDAMLGSGSEDFEDGDEDESMEGDESDAGYETMERLKDDLFADDEDDMPQEGEHP